MCLASLLDVIGVLRKGPWIAQFHKVGHILKSRLVHLGIGLLFLYFEEVPKKPPAANVTPVKKETNKDVKQEQWTV